MNSQDSVNDGRSVKRRGLAKQFLMLYIKELRAHSMVVGLLLVATLGLGLYAFSGTIDELSPRMILIFLPYASAVGLPFLLIHAISTEWTGQTHYQMLALPVSRSAVLLAKVAMVLSVGLVIFISSTAFLHMIAERLLALIGSDGFQGQDSMVPYMNGTTLWVFAGGVYGILLLPLLGIACTAAGVRVMAQRFKGVKTLAVFVLGGYLFAKLQFPAMQVLKRVFGFSKWELGFTLPNGAVPASDIHVLLLFAALFAAAGIGIGALLFEKYVEI